MIKSVFLPLLLYPFICLSFFPWRLHVLNNLTTNQNTTLNLNQSYLVTLWMCGLGDGEVKNSSEFSNLDAVERS